MKPRPEVTRLLQDLEQSLRRSIWTTQATLDEICPPADDVEASPAQPEREYAFGVPKSLRGHAHALWPEGSPPKRRLPA